MAKNRQRGKFLFNLLTMAILLATLAVIAVYALIFINPDLPFNPFPPPTGVSSLDPGPTATDTPAVYLPPTWTATVVTSTASPSPTRTPRPSATQTEEPSATATTDPDATESPVTLPYVLQTNSPSYTENFANGQECSWHGIAGQVFDTEGAPQTGITVHLSGTLDGQEIDLYAESGSADSYGPAGYEFVIGESPVTTTNTLWIQVYDEDAEAPLSEKIFLSTYNDCERNLILVNWNRLSQ